MSNRNKENVASSTMSDSDANTVEKVHEHASTSQETLQESKKPQSVSLDFFDTKSNAGGLQDAFKRFRQRKIQTMKNEKYLAESSVNRKDPARKQWLRTKFIEKARSYYGIPYAKRYHEPGTAMYDSPLFLDCCGLVRHCINDLKEDFGFTLGRWNQAYQFDTLPIRKESHTELQPGDLIFYSATYYSSKAKKQRHDMVHVEIFVGGETGEASIGARWQKGVVRQFDSYKFESKLYYDIKFHYCSIDTWLEGVCESCCNEHPWTRVTWEPTTHSIFNVEEEQEEAGYDEEECDGDESCGEPSTAATASTGTGSSSSSSSNKPARSAVVETPFFGKSFNCRGNGSALVMEALSKHGWHSVADQFRFSPKFGFKWVERRSDIDFQAFKPGLQMVNHIPTTSAIVTKSGLLTSLQEYEAAQTLFKQQQQQQPDSSSSTAANTDVMPMVQFFPETYRLNQAADAMKLFQLYGDNQQDGVVWVTKPTASNQGQGIALIDDLAELRHQYLGSTISKQAAAAAVDGITESSSESQSGTEVPLLDNSQRHRLPQQLIQRYITNPLLIDGYKCDFRAFCLISKLNPLQCYFHPGYGRCCSAAYSLTDLGNRHAHLTNLAVQRSHPNFNKQMGGNIKLMEEVEQYLPGKMTVDQLHVQMKKLMVQVMRAGQSQLQANKYGDAANTAGMFDLLAFDFVLDSAGQLWLLEVNTNPALFVDTVPLATLLPPMVESMIQLLLSVNGALDAEEEEEEKQPSASSSLWELLLDDDVKQQQQQQ